MKPALILIPLAGAAALITALALSCRKRLRPAPVVLAKATGPPPA